LAVTPDGRLVVVSAPNRYDRTEKRVVLGTYLQAIDLEARPPKIVIILKGSVKLSDRQLSGNRR
jgi:hypothetical protein